MIEHGFTRTSVITRLRRGPLGPHLDALATILHQHGYAPDSIRRTLRAGEQAWETSLSSEASQQAPKSATPILSLEEALASGLCFRDGEDRMQQPDM
jgi:hypothetical protein